MKQHIFHKIISPPAPSDQDAAEHNFMNINEITSHVYANTTLNDKSLSYINRFQNLPSKFSKGDRITFEKIKEKKRSIYLMIRPPFRINIPSALSCNYVGRYFYAFTVSFVKVYLIYFLRLVNIGNGS